MQVNIPYMDSMGMGSLLSVGGWFGYPKGPDAKNKIIHPSFLEGPMILRVGCFRKPSVFFFRGGFS